jgi:serine/threonine protein kinase
LERILAVDYNFPTSIPVSPECKDLLAKILVADPAKRYTIADIQQHPWSASLKHPVPCARFKVFDGECY